MSGIYYISLGQSYPKQILNEGRMNERTFDNVINGSKSRPTPIYFVGLLLLACGLLITADHALFQRDMISLILYILYSRHKQPEHAISY